MSALNYYQNSIEAESHLAFSRWMKARERIYPFVSRLLLQNTVTEAKAKFPELATVNAQVLQQVLRKLETAFLDMKRKDMGFPRFKNRYRMRSFVYPQMGRSQLLKGNQIKLPQLGWMEYVKSREVPDGFAIKQARIIRKASGYFVQLTLECDVSVPDVMPNGHAIGIDIGLDVRFVG